jgi:predicted transposase/invertase (TIGR01784 family)
MSEKPLISFDYAIKYLLKDKGDYEIVEGFISALLKSQGYKDVKIISLLDTESNKENSKSRRSLADVVVEDEEHRKYIVEIERNVYSGFIHKACFNTSRLIVDNLAQKVDYTEIVKVFHISILYFPVGKGPIHHGQTIIRDIETRERLTVHIKNPETDAIVDATDILPEYFFISVPLFNDRLEREIDDWLYVMKHDAVPETFQSAYMEKVADKLSILKMTPVERDSYYSYLKQVYTDRDQISTAMQKGKEEGRKEGEQIGITKGEQIGMAKGEQKLLEEKNQIARNFLELGLEAQTISQATGLTVEEIKALT